MSAARPQQASDAPCGVRKLGCALKPGVLRRDRVYAPYAPLRTALRTSRTGKRSPFPVELQSRRVKLAGCTANPSGNWVTQQARNLSFSAALGDVRFLIHDRDSKFSAAFDGVFRSEGIRVIRTPFRAPRANAHAERFVRTARAECLDWLLILGPRHLERVLRVFVEHYNRERPHRALGRCPPVPIEPRPHSLARAPVKRRDRLGGLLHEYYRAAA